jgi:oligoendopeptidase F
MIHGDKRPGKRHTVWNLRLLFENDRDPRIEDEMAEVERKSYGFINKWKNRKDYLRDPEVLRQALDEYEEWKRDCGADGNPGYYFWLRTQQDQNSPDLKARFNKMEEFSRKIENDIQFFYLGIGKIPLRLRKKFLDYPGLKNYRHFIDRIFAESRHLLGEREERIMNLKSSTSYSNWVKMTAGFLVREERKVLLEDGRTEVKTFSDILSLMNSAEKKVRDSAGKAFNDILERHVDVAEAELNSVLANKKVDDELRNFSRPDLSRHISDDVDSEVVDCLIEAVSKRFDIPAKYYGLKARLLGVRKLKYHDRNADFGGISNKYSFAASRRLVHRVLTRLDREFADIFESFVKNGQIDVYTEKGKASGAFCVHHCLSQPTFILLNHTGTLHDVLTMAHEVGHGINNELIRKRQNALNFGTPTSTAEVASTFFEDFVLEEILRGSDDEQRLAIMVMKLNDDVSTIFRQAACYRFERELHKAFGEKGYLSKDEIGAFFRKHMSAYMGDFVEQSPGSENWWVYWGHIRYFFYVYSYAGGLLISKSLQNSVKKDPAFVTNVKEFLSAGLSDSPGNIFRKLGIDITDGAFWNSGLDEVENLLKKTTELARRLGKI